MCQRAEQIMKRQLLSLFLCCYSHCWSSGQIFCPWQHSTRIKWFSFCEISFWINDNNNVRHHWIFTTFLGSTPSCQQINVHTSYLAFSMLKSTLARRKSTTAGCGGCDLYELHKCAAWGIGGVFKTDDFLEKTQTAFDPLSFFQFNENSSVLETPPVS